MTYVGLVYMNDEPQLSMGLACISAVLKENGHTVRLWDAYYQKDDDIVRDIVDSGIDIAMFSVHTLAYKKALAMSKAIKKLKPEIKILFGGWHSVIDPEGMIKEPSIDMVCVGEGEFAALDVANNLDNVSKIPNIWSKHNGKIIKNHPRKLGNLDDLPFPDRSIFNPQSLVDRNGKFFFSTGRGCPYNCSFCCNKKMVGMYSTVNSPYVRFRSIENCMAELKMIKERYGPKEIFFIDEMFLVSDARTKDFCKAYKDAGINIPFGFMARVEKINDETARILKDAGCIRIHFGVESGNEEMRKTYLNRIMTNKQIIRAFDICRKYDIKTASFNMIGLPFETKETIKDTFEINKRCKPDAFQASILYPFAGTEIRETYEKNNLLDSSKMDDSCSLYDACITKNPKLPYSYIKHQQVFMELYFNHSKIFAYFSKIVPTKMLNRYMVYSSFIFKKNKFLTIKIKVRRKLGMK